jgi:hypothetical protein
MLPYRPPHLLAWLKGPPLSVFLAIARYPGVGPSAISRLTGWGRGATYGALRQLAGIGWIRRPSRGRWVLTDTGRLAFWTLVGMPEALGSLPRRAPRGASASMAGSVPPSGAPRAASVASAVGSRPSPSSPAELSPSDTSRDFSAVSPSGTNRGPAAPEISPDDIATRFPISPEDTSRALESPPGIPADDTSPV